MSSSCSPNSRLSQQHRWVASFSWALFLCRKHHRRWKPPWTPTVPSSPAMKSHWWMQYEHTCCHLLIIFFITAAVECRFSIFTKTFWKTWNLLRSILTNSIRFNCGSSWTLLTMWSEELCLLTLFTSTLDVEIHRLEKEQADRSERDTVWSSELIPSRFGPAKERSSINLYAIQPAGCHRREHAVRQRPHICAKVLMCHLSRECSP